ncbi:DegT/DnrJ/EryC1/StrS family aminotransferase [Devosia aquimaris]|uniref:DegT/DnrJ/EryC1/StrS family aminotransferase n=1 Tax=Devosia aquimaris TaxID=2866214 RepID=UPI001CD06C2C|nr:DegT/DnrJ/EryC1/StrS family aminotransferase [Devosia sp. CJK-A8-3]
MSNDTLALFGGTPAIAAPLEPFHSIGEDEVNAASAVIRSGVLSAYIGAPGEGFMGGPHVKAFEAKAAKYFGVRNVVAVNSWTSGLIAAVGAIGIEPGDEIITTPWTMAATATAILHFNGIPVFADIDPVTFNIDPASVEKLISPRTRAIMAVDIFGQSADMRALRAIADKHGIKLLSDTAQAPGALQDNKYAGTLADIGGYSLNYHKHIHSGEGGIIVTEDDRLADRMRLIRNHAEAVIRSSDPAELNNMLGYNFRMGEIEAAIASVQLDKLAARVASRQKAAEAFTRGIADLPGLTPPVTAPGNTNVYYVYGMKLDVDALGVSRERLVEALRAEGVPWLMAGYQNVHLYPLFQHKIAYGSKGFPWNQPFVSRDIDYSRGICPVAEDLHARTFLGLNLCMGEYGDADIANLVAAFHKVWGNLDALKAK